jgi:hypothetical protein
MNYSNEIWTLGAVIAASLCSLLLGYAAARREEHRTREEAVQRRVSAAINVLREMDKVAPKELSQSERELRALLGRMYCGKRLITDGGEMLYADGVCIIDFLRDIPEDIERKIIMDHLATARQNNAILSAAQASETKH